MFDKDQIKPIYSTDKDNILGDFHLPVLSNATRYDRAVGYFSTENLSLFTRGVLSLKMNFN
jgi:hypothetical protein